MDCQPSERCPYGNAVHLEEGRYGTSESSSDEKRGSDSPTTISPDPKFTERFLFAVQAIKKARTWPESIKSKISEAEAGRAENKTKIQKLENYPQGYPKVSCYLDNDEQFMIYRRFGLVHARLLLHKQDDLRRMEDDLLDMDKRDSRSDDGRRCLRSSRMDQARKPHEHGRESRNELLERMEKKTIEYGQLLLQAQQLVAMNKPPSRDHKSLVNFIENDPNLLAEGDDEFVYHKEDLVTLRSGREYAWLDATVERILQLLPTKPTKYLFCTKETRMKTDDDFIRYFTRSRINFVVTLIITLLILTLLIVPIWLLYYFTVSLANSATDKISIVILLVSTLLFSGILSLFTRARRHEIFFAAASYCAVLVVFLSNVGTVEGTEVNP